MRIDPSLITLEADGELEMPEGDRLVVHRVRYAGVEMPDRIRAQRGADVSDLALVVVRDGIAGMSAHERLQFAARVQDGG